MLSPVLIAQTPINSVSNRNPVLYIALKSQHPGGAISKAPLSPVPKGQGPWRDSNHKKDQTSKCIIIKWSK